MAEQTYQYSDEAAFSEGSLQDVQWELCGLRLREDCYTGLWSGPQQACAPFDRLALSWNAGAPKGAGLRMRVRVYLNDAWTGWLDWGLWSPLCDAHRAAPQASECVGAAVREGVLYCDAAATAFQLQAEFSANERGEGPQLYLAAASLQPVAASALNESEPLYHRASPVPAYSQYNRDPNMAGRIGGAVCATMLMNRWGEDLLPERVAHNCADWAGNWENPAYLAAGMGLYGYQAIAAFGDAAMLKKELKAGFACAAALRAADGARWVVVRGFDTAPDGAQTVLLNDPNQQTDEAAAQAMPFDEFCTHWSGLALLMHEKAGCRAAGQPARLPGELRGSELPGAWALLRLGERVSLPVDLCLRDGRLRGTVCYTVRDGHAYASTAHKRFFYTDITATGDLQLDTCAMPAGTQITAYVIQPHQTITACLTL